MTGASPSVVFDPVAAVPEPTTCSLLAGAALLALVFRRRPSLKYP